VNRAKCYWLFPLILLLVTSSCRSPYSNPPKTVQNEDIAGTWESKYSERRHDTLVIRADGTFQQVYEDETLDGYVFETPWNKWWVERYPDGRVRLHLQGARFYLEGTDIGELHAMSTPPPHSFYDPLSEELVPMVGELILNVQGESGQLVLLHLMHSSDQGYLSLTGKADGFRRVGTP
jgi:hypothetical protein